MRESTARVLHEFFVQAQVTECRFDKRELVFVRRKWKTGA